MMTWIAVGTALQIAMVVAGHFVPPLRAWWGPGGPADDPLGTDQAALHQSRAKILAMATVVVPGHGPAFRPGPDTPR